MSASEPTPRGVQQQPGHLLPLRPLPSRLGRRARTARCPTKRR